VPTACTSSDGRIPDKADGIVDRLYVKWAILSYLTLHKSEYERNSEGLRVQNDKSALNIARKDIERLLYEWDLFEKAVSTILLPIIYAWLGVCAYLLRDVSKKIENRTWIPERETQSSLRVAMALLAGFIVGLFNHFELKIAPLALAFVVGYSVELFFNLVDSIMSGLKKSE